MVQVLARPVTLAEYEADIVKLRWHRYYEQSNLEIGQSAQRTSRAPWKKSDHPGIIAQQLNGLPVAYIRVDTGLVLVLKTDPETGLHDVIGTVLPYEVALELRFSNIFFDFSLKRVGKVLYTHDVVLNKECFKNL